MRHSTATIVSMLMLLFVPGAWGPGAEVEDAARVDPYEEVVQALEQGRHWHARRLLARMDSRNAADPAAAMLTARADAGRGAWKQVVRRLSSANWLDAIDLGDGRALLARSWLELDRSDLALEHYTAFLQYSVEREPRGYAEIGRARALNDLSRYQEAAASYIRAIELLPELEPWLAMSVAENSAAGGDTATVRRYTALASQTPRSRRLQAIAEAHLATGNERRAVSLLLQAANSSSRSSQAADQRTRAARILLARPDTAAARRILRTAVRVNSRHARDAADLLALLPGLRPSDHLHMARAYERSRYRTHAVSHYRQWMEQTRLSRSQRQQLQLRIGRLLFYAGWHTAAIAELEDLLEAGAPRAVAARAEYYIARATYRRGLRGGGRARLRDVADRYSGTSAAINSLLLLADVYEGAGRLAQARQLYVELAETYPWTQSAGQARFRLGILAYLDGDYEEARKHFDRCRQAFREARLRTRATYWAARARMAAGGDRNQTEANRLFRLTHARDPFGYYGLLAAERVDIDPWAGLPPGPEPAPIDSATSQKFSRIEMLERAGLHREAEEVLGGIVNLRPRSVEEMLGLAAGLAEHGYGHDAVRFGWRAHARLRGRWSVSVLRAIYPLTYSEILLAESRNHRLDPHLLAAVVRQESAFEPDVVSHAGARGLLQIMPPTGRWWAARLGVRDYDDDLLFHPETNVHLGAAYLADLQRRYDEIQLALVAYNAGPTRARRWRTRPAYAIDPELFAERIPFRETRGYVQNIQSQLRIYRQLYDNFGEAAAD